jgi:hypothetical protein
MTSRSKVLAVSGRNDEEGGEERDELGDGNKHGVWVKLG